MEVVVSERLQAIADRKDSEALVQAADVDYSFDVNDVDDCAGLFEDGLGAGLRLYSVYQKAVEEAAGKEVRVFKITHTHYGDDDGLVWFVGTEDAVASALESLEDEDDG